MTEEDRNINIEISKIIEKECKDFCNDLNAMHDIWKWLHQNGDGSVSDSLYWESLRTSYGEQLENYAQCMVTINGGCLSYVLPNLTAKQKAICFLNAFNKTRE
jgi:hypothetical protein